VLFRALPVRKVVKLPVSVSIYYYSRWIIPVKYFFGFYYFPTKSGSSTTGVGGLLELGAGAGSGVGVGFGVG
jgi:hypothetical protein